MEATPIHHKNHQIHHILPRISQYTSSPSHHQRNPTENVGAHVDLPMRHLPHLPFLVNRIQSTPSLNTLDPQRILRPSSLVNHMEMKDTQLPDSAKNSRREKGEEEAEKKKEEEEEKRPPPPVQPEAGDCCGSGCVRCVWDVYYEELEEYNKLYGSDSKLS